MDRFARRREELTARFVEHDIEGALISKPASIYYLTGFSINPHERFAGLFLYSGGGALLVVPDLERKEAEKHFPRVVGYSDHQHPRTAVERILKENPVQRFGVEKEALSLERAEWLLGMDPPLQLFGITPLLEEMRAIKSGEEAELLREAARMVDEVIRIGLTRLRRGMTEIQWAGQLEAIAKELGSERMAFETAVLSGAKSAAPHGKPDHSPIREGEFLLVDIGVCYKGYCSDITRTFMVGDGTPRHREIYEAVLHAQQKAIEGIRPGLPLGELDRVARSQIARSGYGAYFTHRLGHGLGLEVHEYPSVHGENRDLMQPGLVFTVEPGIYIPDFGGVRIEDDVLVTSDGVEVLTKYPKDWLSSSIYFA